MTTPKNLTESISKLRDKESFIISSANKGKKDKLFSLKDSSTFSFDYFNYICYILLAFTMLAQLFFIVFFDLI